MLLSDPVGDGSPVGSGAVEVPLSLLELEIEDVLVCVSEAVLEVVPVSEVLVELDEAVVLLVLLFDGGGGLVVEAEDDEVELEVWFEGGVVVLLALGGGAPPPPDGGGLYWGGGSGPSVGEGVPVAVARPSSTTMLSVESRESPEASCTFRVAT